VGHAALQRDRVVLGAPRRFARGGGIAALAVLDHFGGALEHPDLADAGDVTPVPLDAELEILIRIETLCVDAELGHDRSPYFVRGQLWDVSGQ
jgi:hypothetical protein